MNVRRPSDIQSFLTGDLSLSDGMEYPTKQGTKIRAARRRENGPGEGAHVRHAPFSGEGHRTIGSTSYWSRLLATHQERVGHSGSSTSKIMKADTTTPSSNRRPNDRLVPLVHFPPPTEVNEKTARRRSGNTARSPRSLRLAGGTHVCARETPPPYILLSERRERSERVGYAPVPSGDYLVPFSVETEGNEVNEVGAHV